MNAGEDLSGFDVLAGATRLMCRSIIRQCYHAVENLTGLASVVGADGAVSRGSGGEDCGVGIGHGLKVI
jgi:hypothetical protein